MTILGKSISLLCIALSAALIFSFNRRIYLVQNYQYPTLLLLHSDEGVFIFVGNSSSGIETTRFQAWWNSLDGEPLKAETFSEDLHVVFCTDNTISTDVVRDFGFGGFPFVANGKLHWKRGGNTSTSTWEWQNGDFSLLPHDESNLLASAKENQWQEKSIRINPGSMEQSLEFQNKLHTVEAILDNGRLEVLLRENLISNRTRKLLSFPSGTRAVTKQEYTAFMLRN